MSQRIRSLSVLVRAGLVIGAVLLFSLIAAISIRAFQTRAAAADATCSYTANSNPATGGTETVTLNGGTTTLSDAAGVLKVSPGCTGLGNLTATTGGITAIVLTDGAGVTKQTVKIDESGTNNVFPCTSFSGTLANDTVSILGDDNESITVGSSGINLNNCTAAQVGTLTGVANYSVMAGSNTGAPGSLTLSAAGGAGTGQPLNVPATLDGTAGTQADTFVAGGSGANGTGGAPDETFKTDSAGSKMDFSNAYSSCPHAPCTLTINAQKVSLASGLTAFTAQAADADGNLAAYDFTTGSDTTADTTDFTTINGLSSGITNLFGGAGTFAVNDIATGSKVVAGNVGPEAFTVNNSSGVTFMAGPSGNDTFTAGGTGNTIDFTRVPTTNPLNPLTIDTTNANGSAATANNSITDTFKPNGTDALNVDFPNVLGSTPGNTVFKAAANGPLGTGPGGFTFTGAGTGNSAVFANTPVAAANGIVANLSGGSQQTSANIGPVTLSGFSLNSGQVLVGEPNGATSCDSTTLCDTLAGSGISTLTGPAFGSSTFYGGPGPTALTFNGNGKGNTFVAGTGPETFNASNTGNTADFSQLNTTGTQLNVDTSTATGSAKLQSTSTPYSFGPLSPVSDFANVIGPSTGNTIFKAGATGGFTFQATGSNNTADFSPAGAGLTVDLSRPSGVVAPSGVTTASCQSGVPPCDTITGITSVIGSSAGSNNFVAGSATGASSSGCPGECFSDLGTVGGDKVDFSHLQSNSSTSLVVNLSNGQFASGQVLLDPDEAALGNTTYTFSSNGDFTSFVSPSTGNTRYLASPNGGYSFQSATGALDPTDSVDFSLFTASAGVTFDYSAGSGLAGVVRNLASAPPAASTTDTITGITTVTGTSFGHNVFVAGASGGTFNSSGLANTIDLSNVPAPVVNVPGSGSPDGTAVSTTGSVYNFKGFGTNPTTFIGSATSGTTFFATSAADTFIGHNFSTDELSFASAPGNSLLVCTAVSPASSCPQTGRAILSGQTENFAGITTFDGLAAGSTTFVAGMPAGFTFHATGTNNAADFSPAGAGLVVDLSSASGQVHPTGLLTTCQATPTVCDTLTGIKAVTGSSSGSNDFIAGPVTQVPGVSCPGECFSDTGTVGGDKVDFTHLQSNSNTPLVVNLSNGQFATGQVLLGPDEAALGNTTYTFSTNGDFTSFVSPSSGNTRYLASPNGGYSFQSAPGLLFDPTDSVDFSLFTASAGVTFDYSAGSGLAGVVRNLASAPPAASTTDTITGITTVTGTSFGHNVFVAGASGGTFNSSGLANTIDLSNVPAPVVNVPGSGSPDGTAVSTTGSVYNFKGFGTNPTTFIGSATSGTTFFATSAADTFIGHNFSTDELSFASAPGNSLLVCTAVSPASSCPQTGRAILSGQTENFAGITTFDGLAAGSTTFVAGMPAGFTFHATGTNNAADFSPAGAGLVVDLSSASGQVHPTGLLTTCQATPTVCDTLTGIKAVTGSSSGSNDFIAGPVTQVPGVSCPGECFSDTGTVGGDKVDFTHLQSNSNTPLVVNLSNGQFASGQVLLGPDQAALGNTTYTFSTNGDFTSFVSPSSGNTRYLASPNGGYSFQSAPGLLFDPTDSVDFSLFTASAGVTFDYSAGSGLAGVVRNLASAPPAASTTDTITGITTVTGTSFGHNVFVAGASGGTFNSSGLANTIDLSNVTAPVVNVPGQSGSPDGTAVSTTGSVYNFKGFGTNPTTFIGSATSGTTFFATSAADTFIGKSGTGLDTLDFSKAQGGPLAVCVTSVPAGPCANVPAGISEAILGGSGGVVEPFAGINTFHGLTNGNNNSFVAGSSGGYTFDVHDAPSLAANSADFTNANSGLTLDLSSTPNQVTGFTACQATCSDSLKGTFSTVTGSQSGKNIFLAGKGSESFADNGTTGGDTVDFTNVNPTTSTLPLDINLTGVADTSGVQPFTASNLSATYTFNNNLVTPNNNSANFVSFIGARNGFTNFEADATSGGYTFVGKGRANTADFSSDPNGITADLTNNLTPNVDIGGGNGTDTLGGSFLTLRSSDTIMGAPADNIFYANVLGTTLTAAPGGDNSVSYLRAGSAGVKVDLSQGQVTEPSVTIENGIHDTLGFPTGSLTIQGSPGNDDFVAGPSPVTIQGGGGQDALDFSQVPAPASGTKGVTVNLNNLGNSLPSVTGTKVGAMTFTTGCSGNATTLCLSSIIGSTSDDTFIVNSLQPLGPGTPLNINGLAGTDTLDLSQTTSGPSGAATVCMPITSNNPVSVSPCGASVVPPMGAAEPLGSQTPGLTFTAVSNLTGTSHGGDYVYAGTDQGKLTESQSNAPQATLDFTNVPLGANGSGVAVSAVTSSSGSVTITPTGVTDPWINFGRFVGTSLDDTFSQTGGGTYQFFGGPGSNSLDLSSLTQKATINLQLAGSIPPPAPALAPCSSTTTEDDGTSSTVAATDTFSCMSTITGPAASSTFNVSPGENATLNGTAGTLNLNDSASGTGVTVDLSAQSALTPIVTSDNCNPTPTTLCYNLPFTGMSTVMGTSHNDTFIPGPSNVTLLGGGGQDGLNYQNASSPVVVNLSTSSYTYTPPGTTTTTTVPACTTTGGNGGTVKMNALAGSPCTLSNVTGSNAADPTTGFTDILVGGSGFDTLTSGAQGGTFVPTNGGRYRIVAGTGASTLDLRKLGGVNSVNLADTSAIPQPLANGGSITLVSGNAGIQTAYASPGGGQLIAGSGDVTLIGGIGNDRLIGGSGDDTLMACSPFPCGGGSDVLVGGVGNDTMEGGNKPVTFEPGEGHTVLTSLVGGNTLSYPAATQAVKVNLTNAPFVVPSGASVDPVPFAGNLLDPLTATGGFPGSSVDLTSAGITTVNGTSLSDLFVIGPGTQQTINGVGGNDLFAILGGTNNKLVAGPGSSSRFLIDGLSTGTLTGGGTKATTIDFSQAPSGVQANLTTGTASGGFPSSSLTFSGIQTVVGTNFTDTIVAGPLGGDTMFGGAGNDFFFALNHHVDSIDGGTGFNYAQRDSIDSVKNIQTGSVG